MTFAFNIALELRISNVFFPVSVVQYIIKIFAPLCSFALKRSDLSRRALDSPHETKVLKLKVGVPGFLPRLISNRPCFTTGYGLEKD